MRRTLPSAIDVLRQVLTDLDYAVPATAAASS